jgi:hypothetical protein
VSAWRRTALRLAATHSDEDVAEQGGEVTAALPDAAPVAKGKLCGQHAGFNLQAATKVAANDKKGRENLCKYILRPPLANDRLKIIDDGNVRLEFKRPWSDGMTCSQCLLLSC